MENLKGFAQYEATERQEARERQERHQRELEEARARQTTQVQIGLDLGKIQDFTALVIAERARRDDGHLHHVVRAVERMALGTSYPHITDRVAKALANVEALGRKRQGRGGPGIGRIALVVDATGVGIAATDLLRERGLRPVAVTITGTDRQTAREDGVLSVGKAFLVSRLQISLQAGRLHLPNTPEAGILVDELKDYRIDVSDRGTASFNARSGQHDDLVLALALAVAVDVPAPTGTAFAMATVKKRGGW